MTQYKGFDVLEVEPSFDQPESNYTRSVFTLDSKTGKLSATDRSGIAVVEPNNFRWVMNGRAEIQAYWDFISARVGRAVPFWVPTWRVDLPLTADVPATNVNLVVQSIGYTRFVFGNRARQYVALILPDRSMYYRKITTAAELSEDVETVQLDAGVPVNVPASGALVSFLTLVRLAVDDPELLWHSQTVAECTLDMVEIPLEVPA